MKKSIDMKPVLAKIQHQNSLSLSTWYEVVYFNDCDQVWMAFEGSRTFKDGEQVLSWEYVENISLPNQ